MNIYHKINKRDLIQYHEVWNKSYKICTRLKLSIFSRMQEAQSLITRNFSPPARTPILQFFKLTFYFSPTIAPRTPNPPILWFQHFPFIKSELFQNYFPTHLHIYFALHCMTLKLHTLAPIILRIVHITSSHFIIQIQRKS